MFFYRLRPKAPDWLRISDRPVRPELVEGLLARSALASTSSARTVEEDMSGTCTYRVGLFELEISVRVEPVETSRSASTGSA